MINRRKFLKRTGMAATALAVSPRFAFAGAPSRDRKVRIGIVGGGFGTSFYFHEHPNCIVEAVSDLRSDRRARLMEVYKCEKSYESLEKLLGDPKIEAVFLATPAPDHARHVIATLNAGKHVLCAVPAAWTLEECADLRDAVKRTGLTYMMAETSAYQQITISAKKLYQEGHFGRIFAAEAEYNHPESSNNWLDSNSDPAGEQGNPPMYYATHALAYLISVTGERLTHVRCVEWRDESPLLDRNLSDNPFWDQSALFKSNRDTTFRVRILQKGALNSSKQCKWYGDKMRLHTEYPKRSGPTAIYSSKELDANEERNEVQKPVNESFDQTLWWQTEMLPEPLRHDSGHGGSHTFITHEFIDSIINNRSPEVDIYEAIAYTAPGLIAHQSALRNGMRLEIPSFDP